MATTTNTQRTLTTYQLSDGLATEAYDTLAEACSAAEGWYGYMLDQADDISEAQREAIYGADFAGCADVSALNLAIGEWEGRIAEAAGHKNFYGHGRYHVSAADQMGLRLECSEIVEPPTFADVRAGLDVGVYPADELNPPSGSDCTHLLVREDGSLGWCDVSGEQSEDGDGNISSFTAAALCDEED